MATSRAKGRISERVGRPALRRVKHTILRALDRHAVSGAGMGGSTPFKRRVVQKLLAVAAALSKGGNLLRGRMLESFWRARSRISTVLSRPILTEADKRRFRYLKTLLVDSLARRIGGGRGWIIAGSRRLMSLVDNLPTRRAAGLGATGKASSTKPRGNPILRRAKNGLGLVSSRARSGTLALGREAHISVVRKQLLSGYGATKLWLKKPVTVGTALACMAIWAVALSFTRFDFPYSEIGFTSGFGAVFMTAAMTARLALNSQTLMSDRSRAPVAVVSRRIIESTPARREMVLRELEDFLASSFEGRPKEINLKVNAFLLRRKDWHSLQEALYDTFRKGAPPLLYELGLRLGASVGRDLTMLGEEPGEVLAQLEEVSRALGWGTVSVHGDLSRGSRLTFEVRESPFCVGERTPENNTYSCHMLCGIMSGISEEVYGWPCSSFEQSCVRDGQDCCKIVVTSGARTADSEGWKLSVLFPARHPWVR